MSGHLLSPGMMYEVASLAMTQTTLVGRGHLLDAEVEGVHPQPEEGEVDERDGDAVSRPRREVHRRILLQISLP